MGADTDLSLTALAVSLIALVIAVGQLLQQMFATADGYRRCQDSIIGPWAKKTHAVWRWRQFRFETKFTTPEIVLEDGRTSRGLDHIDYLAGFNLPAEIRDTVLPPPRPSIKHRHNMSGDAVTWTSFLQQLYHLSAKYDIPGERSSKVAYRSKIGVIYQVRTWDLMPPDMIRPVASTKLGTLLRLAMRLGMRWENFAMKEGMLRATGNGQSLISTTIQGLGVCFQYNYNPHAAFTPSTHSDDPLSKSKPGSSSDARYREQYMKQHARLHSWATEFLSFGHVSGSPRLEALPMPIAGDTAYETSDVLASTLYRLGASNATIQRTTDTWQMEQIRKIQGGAVTAAAFVINDMIALLSDFLPVPGSTAVRINWPLHTGGGCLSAFLFIECRRVLFQSLKDRASGEPPESRLSQVLSKMTILETSHGDDFYCRWEKAKINDPNVPDGCKLDFLEDLRQIHEWTTTCFENSKIKISYTALVAAHADLSCEAAFGARGHQDNVVFWTETARSYVKLLPTLIDSLKRKVQSDKFEDPTRLQIEEAWWTLVLRGMAWRMSVWPMDFFTAIPSKYYDDPTPVYIL